ncbi:MAG: transglycosylase SLT domain-containing protein [Treponema sp.]|nr:transglycosylase SLT domain-containing protein [Treponema sp.]
MTSHRRLLFALLFSAKLLSAMAAGAALTCIGPEAWAETTEKKNPAPPRRSQRQIFQSGAPERFSARALPPENAGEAPSLAGLDQSLTRRYLERYSGKAGLAWLRDAMERGGPYLAFIRQEVKARNMPPELVYLPVIESGFLPTAMSRSGAAGLWQFMRNSIGGYGMGITDYVDERMDFWKSTQGALRKLEDNYQQLGDWPLALAAYNAGLGAVARLVKQAGIRDYWTLAEKRLLKTETIHYIPKLLAVSHILSNPRRYGFSPSWPEDPRWTRIRVDRSVDLDLLAEHAGVDKGLLKWGNSELRHGITPPSGDYLIKAPQADAPALLAALENSDLSLLHYHIHTIAYGDTLSALALRYGAGVEQILGANPGTKAQSLQIGQKLRIPALTGNIPPPEPAATPPGIAAGSGTAFEGVHLVRRGETLWSIARLYQVDPRVLAEANGMGLNDILREGRILKTPIRQ